MVNISLITDYGTGDNYLSRIKLEILNKLPQANIIELNHHLNIFNINDAAYNCRVLFSNYDFLKYNIILYKQFYQKEEYLLLTKLNDRYFFFPNNGIAFLCYEKEYNEQWLLDVKHEKNYVEAINNIIDILLAIENKNSIPLKQEDKNKICRINPYQPIIQENEIKAHILYIDKKSNIVLNVKKQEFEEVQNKRPFEINLSILQSNIVRNISPYQGTGEDETIAFFNEYNYLSLSIPAGELARILGLTDRYYDYSQEGAMHYPYYNNTTISITFFKK